MDRGRPWRRRVLSPALVVPVVVAAAFWRGPAVAGGGSVEPFASPAASAPVRACTGCHEVDPLLTHPVNVWPDRTPPRELPLHRGRVTCTTCHEPASVDRSDPSRASCASGLRGHGRTLCAACHAPESTDPRDLHATALGRAHLAARPGAVATGDTTTGYRLDRESLGCLGCHDGSVASDAGHPAAGGRGRRRGALGAGHPVGARYRPATRREGAALRPVDHLDDRIQLFDDHVGCGSCHSPFSRHDGLLVMSNDKSSLCLECHDF